jgi:hypothetical protein
MESINFGQKKEGILREQFPFTSIALTNLASCLHFWSISPNSHFVKTPQRQEIYGKTYFLSYGKIIARNEIEGKLGNYDTEEDS